MHAGAVYDAVGEVELRVLRELVARHGDRGPEGGIGGGQRPGRSVAVDHLPHLVVAADLPEARERHVHALRGGGACGGHLEDLRRRLAVLIALPVLAGLVLAVRVERALDDAERVGGVKDPVRHLLAVLVLHVRRRVDLDLVLAGAQVGLAQLDPGHLSPFGQVHRVRRVVGRRDRLPLASVHAPVEGGAHELVADAVPHLVVAGRGRGELIAELDALLRQLGQLVGGDGDHQPLSAREVVAVGPALALGLDVGGGRALALQPDEVRGPGVRTQQQPQREDDQSLHLAASRNGICHAVCTLTAWSNRIAPASSRRQRIAFKRRALSKRRSHRSSRSTS